MTDDSKPFSVSFEPGEELSDLTVCALLKLIRALLLLLLVSVKDLFPTDMTTVKSYLIFISKFSIFKIPKKLKGESLNFSPHFQILGR